MKWLTHRCVHEEFSFLNVKFKLCISFRLFISIVYLDARLNLFSNTCQITRAFKSLKRNQNIQSLTVARVCVKSVRKKERDENNQRIYAVRTHWTHWTHSFSNKWKQCQNMRQMFSCWFFSFIFLKFRYNLFHVVVGSSWSAWSFMNFSTIFFTYLSCRESGLPITSSALYGGFIVTSLNTTMFGPRHFTYNFPIWIPIKIDILLNHLSTYQHRLTYLVNGLWNCHIKFLAVWANISWNRRNPPFLLFTIIPHSCAQLFH